MGEMFTQFLWLAKSVHYRVVLRGLQTRLMADSVAASSHSPFRVLASLTLPTSLRTGSSHALHPLQ